MSRTIAHTPWEIACHNGTLRTTIDHDHRKGECRIETLQDVKQRFGPKSMRYQRGTMALYHEIPCRPQPNWPEQRKLYRNHPPKKFVRNTFTKPARQRARAALHQAGREFNTYGETEIDPEPYRTRHGARLWWDLY